MTDFASRTGTAVVIGGTGGIGEAIVNRLLSESSQVAISYRSNAPKPGQFPSTVSAHQLDVSDPAAARKTLDLIAENSGGIHTLVHAAGPHVPMVHLSRVSPEQFAAQVDSDLVGFFNVTHAALPLLRSTAGSIVVVTSAATARYPVRDGLSAVPKGGVEALARALAVEEGRFGIRVNCVGPGMLTDGMASRLIGSGDLNDEALDVARRNIPLRRFGTSVDIAEAVVFLASDRAQFISGQKLDVDGGYGV